MATGDLIAAQIMDSSALPIGGSGQGGNTDGNGWILRTRISGIAGNIGGTFDVSKISLRVQRPGWNTAKVFSAANITDTLAITGIVRRPVPNDALRLELAVSADLDVYWSIQDYVFTADTLLDVTVAAGFYQGGNAGTLSTGLTNSSTKPYTMPQIDMPGWADWDEMLTASGLACEVAVTHPKMGRNGQPCAAVDVYVTDGTNTSTGSSNAMALSARVTTPYQPGVFPVTVPIGSLAQGRGNLGTKVYPWIGNAVWDTNSSPFDDFPANGTPKLRPVCIDTDGSYAWAGAYISHTGVQIGTPSIGLVSALGAYVPGTTPAFASLSALLLAGKTYNSSGARARTHADVAAIKAVIPSGYKMGGYGANLTSVVTYPPGLRAASISIEAGASKTTTGLTTNANSHPTRFLIDGCGIFPGAAGAATHTVTAGGNNGSSGASTKLSEAAAVYLTVRGCSGTGNDDNTFAVFTATGWFRMIGNSFTAFGKQYLTPSQTYFIALVAIHGCTLDNRTNASGSITTAASIIGSFLDDIAIQTSAAGAGAGDPLGKMVYTVRTRCNETTSTRAFTHYIGHDRAIGARGEGWMNVLATKTLVGGTAGVTDGDASSLAISPVIQVSADYISPNYTDEPTVQNVGLEYCNFVGSRTNIAYNEQYIVGVSTRIVKEVHVLGVVAERKNTKGDNWAVTTGAASGIRTGTFAYRHGTSVLGFIVAQGSNNGTGVGSASWLGENVPVASANNVGLANMFVRDTSLTGTNSTTDLGDYTPKAALKGIIPASLAATKYDLFGTQRKTASAGAAGAVEAPGTDLVPNNATLALAGSAATFTAGISLIPAAGTLALTASTVTLTAASSLAPAAATLALTGSIGTLVASPNLAPTGAVLGLTGSVANLVAAAQLVPAPTTLAFVGTPAVLVTASPTITIQVPPAARVVIFGFG